MKFTKVLTVLLLMNFAIANSEEFKSFLSPGIKLGYAFGEKGGFVFGFEVSYVYWLNEYGAPALGPVFNLDFFNGFTRVHLGIEALHLVGLCVGPTIIFKDGKTHLGYSIIPFAGLYAYPYYNYTSAGEFQFDEVGTYIKLPILPPNFIKM